MAGIAFIAALLLVFALPTASQALAAQEDSASNAFGQLDVSADNATRTDTVGEDGDYTSSYHPFATDKVQVQGSFQASKIGIGGGGALFEPQICPHDSNEMLVIPDMGGIYISHDRGGSWSRAYLGGVVFSAAYDPNRPGVLYAGGSGLWKSTDYGQTFQMLFPSTDDLVASYTMNENSLHYLFTESGLYDRNLYLKDILVDPTDSNHIFALQYASKKGKVFESTDGGATFAQLFDFTKATSGNINFEFVELFYQPESASIYVVHDEGVIAYDRSAGVSYALYDAPYGFRDMSIVNEGGTTYAVLIEDTATRADSENCIYYTSDFANRVDITDAFTSVQPTYFEKSGYGTVTYRYRFRYVSATSLSNIYATSWTYQETSSVKDYPYSIDGVIHYENGTANYLYGNPFRDHNNLSSRSWNDGCTYALGIAASAQNPQEFIFTTLNGVYYSPDNTHIYPRHTAIAAGTYPNATYVTNGIDEQTTYGVREDPFNPGCLLLLNTDLGLVRSEDGGASWKCTHSGIPSEWQNTIYAAEYDKRRSGVVYSLWSGRHDALYTAGNETDGNCRGGFAISFDAGNTWDASYSSGLPAHATPLNMALVYPDDPSGDVTIYVATFNEGFYVSTDAGRTFTPMNNGISRVSYSATAGYQYILAADIVAQDGRVFGITAKSSYGGSTQAGQVLEYKDGTWTALPLPALAETPRDICYSNGVLYVAGTAHAVWDGKNGCAFNNYAGGVFAYKDGAFEQIFDESVSTTGVAVDSHGTLFVADIFGNVYRREDTARVNGMEFSLQGQSDTGGRLMREQAVPADFAKIYAGNHYRSKFINISEDDDRLYLSTHGGGMTKLQGLNSLYVDPDQSAGEAAQTPSSNVSSVPAADIDDAARLRSSEGADGGAADNKPTGDDRTKASQLPLTNDATPVVPVAIVFVLALAVALAALIFGRSRK